MTTEQEIALDIDAAFGLVYSRAGLEERRMAGILGLFRRTHGAELFEAFRLGYPGRNARNNGGADLNAAQESARWWALHLAGDFLARLQELRRQVGGEYDSLWKD